MNITIDENFSGKYIDESGDAKLVIEYVKGVKQGKTVAFSKDERIIYELSFENDVMHGDLIQYYDNGAIFTKSRYQHGKQTGQLSVFYENGMKQIESHYVDGKLHGVSISFDQFGDRIMEMEYDNGVLNGKFVTYYSKNKGGGILELSMYKKGLIYGKKMSFYESGEIMSVTPYEDGKAQEYTKMFLKNGKMM